MAPSPVLFCLIMTTSLVLLLPQSAIAQSTLRGNILYTRETLYAGDALNYGTSIFYMQRDCNLVLYVRSRPVWASQTYGQGRNCRLQMQEDGNLVVYNDGNSPIWASNTGTGRPRNYVLILQRDNNVVVYGPAIWATGTNDVGTPGVIIAGNLTNPAASSVSTAGSETVNAAAEEPINIGKITMVTQE